jgi:hypothetical protein
LKGVGLTIAGGHVNVFNLLTEVDYSAVLAITGGTYALAGAAFQAGFAGLSGGTGVIAGAWFEEPGTQVQVSGNQAAASLWGDIGTGGFHVNFTNSAPPSSTGNISRG